MNEDFIWLFITILIVDFKRWYLAHFVIGLIDLIYFMIKDIETKRNSNVISFYIKNAFYWDTNKICKIMNYHCRFSVRMVKPKAGITALLLHSLQLSGWLGSEYTKGKWLSGSRTKLTNWWLNQFIMNNNTM